MALAALLATLTLAACERPLRLEQPPIPPPAAPAATLATPGDWDDLDAALSAAASRNELAVLRTNAQAPDRRVYDLLAANARPARLEATRDPDGLIHLTATIGRFGDPQAEQRLLRDLAHRLQQLHNVPHAPLRW